MTATGNSLLGTEEQFVAQIATTQKPQQLQHLHIMYNKFVGTEGLKLISSGSWTKTRPGNSLKDLEIIGNSKSFSAGVQNPLIRSRFKSLSFWTLNICVLT
jgi:hemolysin activation/secretion protein